MMFPSLLNPRGLVQTPAGMVYGAAGQTIIPVHSSGPGSLSDAPAWYNENGRTSVQAALSLCRSGRGDIIQLLPGHSETIGADAWSNLAATGVTVRGPDFGPPATLTWSVAGSTLLMDVADFTIDGRDNLIMQMEPTTGTVTVAAPITISAARCKILNCRMNAGTDANNKVTIAVTVNTASDVLLQGIRLYSAVAATATTFFRFTAADKLRMADCFISGATTSATVGPIQFLTTASVDIFMNRLTILHTLASSQNAISFMTGDKGYADYLRLGVLNNAAGNLVINNAAGAISGSSLMQFGADVCVTNDVSETGAKMTAVSA
jgi:hypothetical protein